MRYWFFFVPLHDYYYRFSDCHGSLSTTKVFYYEFIRFDHFVRCVCCTPAALLLISFQSLYIIPPLDQANSYFFFNVCVPSKFNIYSGPLNNISFVRNLIHSPQPWSWYAQGFQFAIRSYVVSPKRVFLVFNFSILSDRTAHTHTIPCILYVCVHVFTSIIKCHWIVDNFHFLPMHSGLCTKSPIIILVSFESEVKDEISERIFFFYSHSSSIELANRQTERASERANDWRTQIDKATHVFYLSSFFLLSVPNHM